MKTQHFKCFLHHKRICTFKWLTAKCVPAGFTTLELLVAMGILAVVSASVYSASIVGYKNQIFLREQNSAIEEAKRGVVTMVQEIREAADGDNGAYPIVLAEDTSFTFFSDIDVDSITEQVRYFVEDGSLKKGTIEPVGNPLVYNPANEQVAVLASYVTNILRSEPLFRYYNMDYPGDVVNNPLSTPANLQEVVLVGVSLQINVTPERAPGDEAVNSFVQIRNLKINL